MKHAGVLVRRILFLEGLSALREAIDHCESVRDFTFHELLEKIL